MDDQARARDLFFFGCDMLDARRFAEAEVALRQALSLAPGRASILANLSTALLNQDKYSQCRQACIDALKADSGNAVARLNLGICYLQHYDLEEAQAHADAALRADPDYAEAYKLRALVHFQRKRHEQAIADLDAALQLDPAIPQAIGLRLISRQEIADWRHFDEDVDAVIAAVSRGEDAIGAYAFLRLPTNEKQRQEAAINAARHLGFYRDGGEWKPWVQDRPGRTDKVCIGYLSSDFTAHALACLVSEMFELHDRDRFEIIAISDNPGDESAERERIAAAVDAFHDIFPMDFAEAARFIADLKLDVLVDLTGFTGFNRSKLLSHRLAPLQVSYIGYAGTMGVQYYDYLIADPTVIPETSRPFYNERVAWIPDTYQVTDTTRIIPPVEDTRADHGLPENSFVFCCLNQPVKITPHDFDVWMAILGSVPGSVLWLYAPHETVRANFRKEAKARGVDPGRLVFAGPLPHLRHLARYRHADLFLDTVHYGAHTTCSDALWAGLPVLTQPGESFAGRVSSSLLKAAGLSDLVMANAQDFARTAIELARDTGKLAGLRSRLAANRTSCALFDTVRTTRSVERLYEAMHARQLAGQPPEHLSLE